MGRGKATNPPRQHARGAMNDLENRLLKAHETGDADQLVALYTEAANATNDPDAEGFYLTHAYVFALELAHPDTATLHKRLRASGREE